MKKFSYSLPTIKLALHFLKKNFDRTLIVSLKFCLLIELKSTCLPHSFLLLKFSNLPIFYSQVLLWWPTFTQLIPIALY